MPIIKCNNKTDKKTLRNHQKKKFSLVKINLVGRSKTEIHSFLPLYSCLRSVEIYWSICLLFFYVFLTVNYWSTVAVDINIAASILSLVMTVKSLNRFCGVFENNHKAHVWWLWVVTGIAILIEMLYLLSVYYHVRLFWLGCCSYSKAWTMNEITRSLNNVKY